VTTRRSRRAGALRRLHPPNGMPRARLRWAGAPPSRRPAHAPAPRSGRTPDHLHDDTGGPTHGERIELSAKVLANWVAKAANLLQDEFDVSGGTSVRLALPAHWRTAYWALACWSVGATVLLGTPEETADPDDLALTVTDDPVLAATADPAVLVTLAGLAPPRHHHRSGCSTRPGTGHLPDVFTAWDEPDPSGRARHGTRHRGIPRLAGPGGRRPHPPARPRPRDLPAHRSRHLGRRRLGRPDPRCARRPHPHPAHGGRARHRRLAHR
jgi:hypothetical protein